MESVTVTEDFQVKIPENIRKALNIHPGQKIQVIQYGSRIEFIPDKELKDMRGFFKGIDTTVKREEDRI